MLAYRRECERNVIKAKEGVIFKVEGAFKV